MSTTQKKIKATDTVLSTNGYYGTDSSTAASFPAGTATNVLKNIVTTAGDIVYCDNTTNKTIAKLGLASTGNLLYCAGSAPAYATPAFILNNYVPGSTGVLRYNSGNPAWGTIVNTDINDVSTSKVVGKITSGSPAQGFIGEYIEASVTSSVSLIVGTSVQGAAVLLTAGVWLIISQLNATNGAGGILYHQIATSLTNTPPYTNVIKKLAIRDANDSEAGNVRDHSLIAIYSYNASFYVAQQVLASQAGTTGTLTANSTSPATIICVRVA
jgi:hypothetical protein